MIKITNFTNKVFFIIAFLILHLRPGIPGQYFGSLYIAIIFLFIGVYCVLQPWIWNRINNGFIVWFASFSGYLIMNSILNQTVGLSELVKSLIINVLPIFLFLSIDEGQLFTLLKSYIKLIALLCISGIITYLLMVFIGFSISNLTLFELKLNTYTGGDHYSFRLLFPFTFIYSGAAIFGGIWLPRFIGFFREPGIFQVLVITAYYLSHLYYSGKKLIILKLILALGLFLCFSTSGIVAFLLAEGIRYLFYVNINGEYRFFKTLGLYATIILGILFLVRILFFSDLAIGVAGKMANKSGISRLNSVLTSFDFLSENPLMGVGYKYFSDSSILENVNLITAGAEIGIIGWGIFTGYIMFLLYRLFRAKSLFFFPLLVYVITIVISQPLYDKPMTVLFLGIGTFFIQGDSIIRNHFVAKVNN